MLSGSRFLWKLFVGYAAIVVATAALIGVLVHRDIAVDRKGQIRESLRASAAIFRHQVEALDILSAPPDSTLQTRIRLLGVRAGVRLTIIRADGVVLADSHEDPSLVDNHGRRPEVLEAGLRGIGSSTRYSETVGQEMMYVALTCGVGSEIAGFVRTAVALTVVHKEQARLQRLIALSGAIGVLFALVLGFFLARSLTRPIEHMTTVSVAIASGDYGQRVEVDRTDEVGQLADAINAMTVRLQGQIESLTADRNQTQAILGGMVEGVVAVDCDERVVHINSAAQSILGVAGAPSASRRIWEVTRIREVSDALSAALRDEEITVGEARIVSVDKEQVIQLTATPLRGHDRELEGAILVLHDVSELRKLEKVRRDFIANISHELKTPLAAIKGLIETLIDDRRMDEDTHARFLDRIRAQSDRLNSLVADLLTISRMESDDGGLQLAEMDLRDPLTQSYRALIPIAETAGVTLRVELPDVPVRINGDAEALRGLVDNLLSNALKFTPGGGTVNVLLIVEGTQAILEVDDTGIGIAPEHQSRIFERFYRVDKARSRHIGGTGLGLSIVKHVALAHGGNISLRSTPGEGSTFRVYIPARMGPGAGQRTT